VIRIVFFLNIILTKVGNGASKFFQGAGQGVGHVFGGGKCFFFLTTCATCKFHSYVQHKFSYINNLDIALSIFMVNYSIWWCSSNWQGYWKRNHHW
ncbi:MAG: hypothetical protein ACI90V_006602, partial [Bacillariaceae sp.]|jgi:hypothetical protein